MEGDTDLETETHSFTKAMRRFRPSRMFNPEAPEFVPSSSAPTKRKASSSAKSGKSDQGVLPPTIPEPLIKRSDLFGADDGTATPRIASPTLQNQYFMEITPENEDHIYGALLVQPPAPRVRPLTAFPRRRGRETKKDVTPTKLSVALVQGGEAGQLRYLPLCQSSTSSNDYTVLPSHRQISIGAENDSPVTWPADEVPVELFDLITHHLSRDDVKTLRLVNHEFERKVSRSLFHTSVVPFNTELYDMIDDEAITISRTDLQTPHVQNKDKGRASEVPAAAIARERLHWKNAKDDIEGKVYKGHGLRVFQGFGPHIKRFGMSFEVSEDQLLSPPAKKELDDVESYHGSYPWPPPHYARFSNLSNLEQTADETSRMKEAFGKLEIVSELALSIDNGLGWMTGPDKSIHGRIFNQADPIFGTHIADRAVQAASQFWHATQEALLSLQATNAGVSSKEITIAYKGLSESTDDLDGLRGTPYARSSAWSHVDAARTVPPSARAANLGVLYTTNAQLDAAEASAVNRRYNVVPNELRKEQKEWLLETEWAQRAFLESYMLAVIDNPLNFERVTTLKIAKLPSGMIGIIARPQLWEALPSLQDVTIHISPDWRSVAKDDAGYAEMTLKPGGPSGCVHIFFSFLRNRIASIESIKKLDIGYVGGGEHARGMFARNNNILPAPLGVLGQCVNTVPLSLLFPHVQHLTLTNCWITPPMLESLVKGHADLALKKLTLDSVSLTAHPRFAPQAQNAGNVNIQQLLQAAPNLPPPQLAQWQNQMQALQANGWQQQGPALPGNLAATPGLNAQLAVQAQALAQAQQHWQQFAAHQQQLNQLQNPVAVPAAPVVLPGAGLPATQAGLPWYDGHREGSWPQLISEITPGPALQDYGPQPAPWDTQLPERTATTLRELEFVSCGYAKLQQASFDQTPIEADIGHQHVMSAWFRARQASLKPAMMESKDKYMGSIVQYLSQRESDALQLAWGLSEGWQDPAKAEEAEFDGVLPGGTGRFSGILRHDMSFVAERQHTEH